MIEPSRILTLFAEEPYARRGPSAFLVSILLHAVGFSLLLLGLNRTARLDQRPPAQRYIVRILNLQQPRPKLRYAAASDAPQPGQQAAESAAAMGGWPKPPALPLKLTTPSRVSQTLVQPDAPPDLLLAQQTPLPSVVMWLPEKTLVKTIVPPPPQEVISAHVRPTLDTPNHEEQLADLKISASAFVTKMPALPPSTTSPLAVHGPVPANQLPQTASKPLAPPVPARVISLSDLQMPEGAVVLPLANAFPSASPSASVVPGKPDGQEQNAGSGNASGKGSGNGTGQTTGDQNGKSTAGSGSVAQNGGPAEGVGAGSPAGDGPSIARINVPKDGQFGVVVVGSSVSDEYPEAAGIWNGRLAYTVYLHVGLSKSWILQYSLPRTQEAAVSGNVVHLIAPWPYYMERPNNPSDPNSDAIMIHGFVTAAGRFEKLAVVFPQTVADVSLLLRSLQQWQFRPAAQSGVATAVEVLLIIPSDLD